MFGDKNKVLVPAALSDQDLVEKLKRNIKLHMKPYNLGDMGETESMVECLMERFETYSEILSEELEKIRSLF